MRTFELWVFDASGNKKAVLENTYNRSLRTIGIEIPSLSFSIRADDDKASFVAVGYYIKVYNLEKTAFESHLFKVQKLEYSHSRSGLELNVEYSGISIELLEEEDITYDTTSTPKTVTQIITALLALQVNPNPITVGTISPTDVLAFAIENTNLLNALNELQKYIGGYFTVDDSRVLDWHEDSTITPLKLIHTQKNVTKINRTIDPTQIANRIYAFGFGETEAQVTLDNVAKVEFNSGIDAFALGDIIHIDALNYGTLDRYEITSGSFTTNDAAGWIILGDCTGTFSVSGVLTDSTLTDNHGTITKIVKQNSVSYLEDATSQASYGIHARRLTNKNITHPATLYTWAERTLTDYSDPIYEYALDFVNLAYHPDYTFDIENLSLGDMVRVIDPDLGIDVNVLIVGITIDLDRPENTTLDLSTVASDLSDLIGNIQNTQHLSESISIQIGAGQVTVQGTFTVDGWRSAGQTTINGGQITANTVTVTQLNFTPTDDTNVVGTINSSSEGITIDANKISITAGRGNRVFRQIASPDPLVVDIASGDLWLDSDDGDRQYRWSGSAWIDVQDSEIAQAIADALAAQGTADLRITSFYQAGIPASLAIGDMWIDTDDDNKLYRAESIGADQIIAGEWVIARDDGIAQAIADAAGAQGTADSKVVTFAQAAIPTSTDIGDLWIDTDDDNKLYRAESIGADQIIAGEWVIVRDELINTNTTNITLTNNQIVLRADQNAATKASVTVSAINGGSVVIDAKNITLDGVVSVTDDLQSSNYVAATTGWIINGDGDAEFNTVSVRGSIYASTLIAANTLTLAGDIKTADSKFHIQTTGIQLKSGAADTTYIDLVQDTAQIHIYDVGTQRVLITPTGAITLTTDVGTPLSINSTSASDCVSITTAVSTRRAIVCSATSGATSGVAAVHITQNSAGGYGLYVSGKVEITSATTVNSLSVTVGSSLHATTITGDLTMAGDADINSVDRITANSISVGTITHTGSITVAQPISMSTHNVTCNKIIASDSAGLHFNGDSTNDVLWSNGTTLYWKNAAGTWKTVAFV